MGSAKAVTDSFAGAGETIWQAAMALQQPTLAGFSVEVLPEVDSTNSELMRRARAGRTEPTLLVAQQQTAGRGRLGRAWHSDAAALHPALTFSLGLLLHPQTWDGLSLAVGTSVADSLHPRIQLKWPNDLWVDGRKLAGILIETVAAPGAGLARFAVIGVGVNIAPRPADGLSTAPAALQELLPDATAATALTKIAPALLRDVLLFEREGFAAFANRFAVRDALRGLAVDVLPSHPGATGSGNLAAASHGLAQGVDARGALLVSTLTGLQTINSAEVSVRPSMSRSTAI